MESGSNPGGGVPIFIGCDADIARYMSIPYKPPVWNADRAVENARQIGGKG